MSEPPGFSAAFMPWREKSGFDGFFVSVPGARAVPFRRRERREGGGRVGCVPPPVRVTASPASAREPGAEAGIPSRKGTGSRLAAFLPARERRDGGQYFQTAKEQRSGIRRLKGAAGWRVRLAAEAGSRPDVRASWERGGRLCALTRGITPSVRRQGASFAVMPLKSRISCVRSAAMLGTSSGKKSKKEENA